MPDDDDPLLHVLTEIRRRGGIGPVDVVDAVVHARGYLAWFEADTGTLVDLGSGGGLPGLVLAAALPGWRVHLIERRAARADLLGYGVRALELTDRVDVVADDAVRWGRTHAGVADLVSARSFAAPLEVLRVARPLLRVGGRVVFSDAPGAPVRWAAADLATFGIADLGSREGTHGFVVVR